MYTIDGLKTFGWVPICRDGAGRQAQSWLFVHFWLKNGIFSAKPHFGTAASAAYQGFLCPPKFSRSSTCTICSLKTLGLVQICMWVGATRA